VLENGAHAEAGGLNKGGKGEEEKREKGFRWAAYRLLSPFSLLTFSPKPQNIKQPAIIHENHPLGGR
jgi:hypothetical protein